LKFIPHVVSKDGGLPSSAASLNLASKLAKPEAAFSAAEEGAALFLRKSQKIMIG